jgi:hypothetical protein
MHFDVKKSFRFFLHVVDVGLRAIVSCSSSHVFQWVTAGTPATKFKISDKKHYLWR